MALLGGSPLQTEHGEAHVCRLRPYCRASRAPSLGPRPPDQGLSPGRRRREGDSPLPALCIGFWGVGRGCGEPRVGGGGAQCENDRHEPCDVREMPSVAENDRKCHFSRKRDVNRPQRITVAGKAKWFQVFSIFSSFLQQRRDDYNIDY